MNLTFLGIFLAFVAMLSWGFGDFFIQKSTRKIGNVETLFFISAFGFIFLLPFVWYSLPNLFSMGFQNIMILLGASFILLLASIINLEALKQGKLSVIEPIWSLEIPIASLLAFLVLNERISFLQITLIICLVFFLVLLSFHEKKFNKSSFLEKAVFLGVVGALVMGAGNFFMGWGGRVTDPLFINFFTDVFLFLVSGIFLLIKSKSSSLILSLKNNFKFILPMSILDNVAWIAFVFSMALAPIAVATALSESYIIIVVLLGLLINKEKLFRHQKIGLVGAIITALFLATITI